MLHLAHPGPGGRQLLTESFSVPGVLTAKLPVSYRASDGSTTSNGYGTLAEAGWNPQAPIPGSWLADGGALAMARRGDELVLLFETGDDGGVRICCGRYEEA